MAGARELGAQFLRACQAVQVLDAGLRGLAKKGTEMEKGADKIVRPSPRRSESTLEL